MYKISKDKVVVLNDFPKSDSGAPCPILLASDTKTYLIYYTPLDKDTLESDVVLVEFKGCIDTMFGGSNDEALNGHPLYSRGLTFYSAHEVLKSSWIKICEKMNSVHPYHDRKFFYKKKHYIITFHDDMFECIADEYTYKIFKGESQRNAVLFDLISKES